MTPDRVVHSIPKRAGEEIRARLNEYKGALYAHLRVYFLSEVSGEWHPTKAGITIAAERFQELEAAVAALRKTIDAAPKKRSDRIECYAQMRSPA